MTQLPLIYQQEERQMPARRLIREMPAAEQPLQRLNQRGAAALSSSELLALVLGSADALDLAQELLLRLGSLHQLGRAGKHILMRVQGIGQTQAARLLAVLELSRRLQQPAITDAIQVTTPKDGVKLLMPAMRDLKREELRTIILNTRNQVMGIPTIYKGKRVGL